MIGALEATGLSVYRISKETGIPQPTLCRIRNGQSDCLLSTHEKILAFCKEKGIDTSSGEENDNTH